LFRGEDDAPAGLGHFVHVYVDSTTRQPVPVPQVIRDALDALRPDGAGRAADDVGGGR
jgi:acyl-CoA thioester hydrolase